MVLELGTRRFGHRPRLGDAFCGGGSIPFEAARLGCESLWLRLEPVAALLTWAALNIIGGSKKIVGQVRGAQERIFAEVDRQVTEWGIEHNENNWRADAFLYCVELRDPESGWTVPAAPSWIIGEGSKTIAKLKPDPVRKRYDIEVIQGASDAEIEVARATGTIRNSRLFAPGAKESGSTPIEVIRRNLRPWERDDLTPRTGDVFQERLYCIRWVETLPDGTTRRHFRAPTAADLQRERRCLDLLLEKLSDWRKKGFIPESKIEPGAKTDEPIRTRGWTYWHHLFTPRQLLTNGLLASVSDRLSQDISERAAALLGVLRCADWNGKLCRWDSSRANEKGTQTFSNQALNPLYNFASRPLLALQTTWLPELNTSPVAAGYVQPADARSDKPLMDLWMSDPPYADAVYYDELSELLLSWVDDALARMFPNWYSDSRRALSVRGTSQDFRRAMVDCYRNLVAHMPDDGLQIIMFTHQDVSVWADLALIVWSAELRVTAAWCIATETDSALKKGNYVQGTVIMVLRRQTNTRAVFIDDLPFEIEEEVRNQLDSMTKLDDASQSNFGDADYQLAAYAAALRVLTRQPIRNLNPEAELLKSRAKGEISPVEKLIRNAVKIACDHLVPRGLDADVWKTLAPLERFYIKGLEVEAHGEHRNGVYQELARGFGAAGYAELLASSKANETRLMTPSEMKTRMLEGGDFAATPLRQLIYSLFRCDGGNSVSAGVSWLRTELADFWNLRMRLIELLDYLARLRMARPMTHWQSDGRAAELLAGALRAAHV